jgi:hypothetical protein
MECAASYRKLTDDQRSKLVNMAIDVRDYVRSRTGEGKQKALDEAISATLHRIRLYDLYPTVSDLVSKGLRDYVGHFPVNPLGEVLEERDGKLVIPNDQVCAIFFNDSAESADAIRAYLRADGDPLSLEDYGGYLLRQSGVIAGDGALDLQKLADWEQRYASALSVLPGLQGKLDVAREAQGRLCPNIPQCCRRPSKKLGDARTRTRRHPSHAPKRSLAAVLVAAIAPRLSASSRHRR